MSVIRTVVVLPPAFTFEEFLTDEMIEFCHVAAPSVYHKIIEGQIQARFDYALLSVPTPNFITRPPTKINLNPDKIRLERYKE
jgi:hypothetical protein